MTSRWSVSVTATGIAVAAPVIHITDSMLTAISRFIVLVLLSTRYPHVPG